MSNKPKDSAWGGRRQGSGRKPWFEKANLQREHGLKLAKKIAKEKGLSLDEVLIRIGYGEGGATVRDRIAAIKVFKEFILPRQSESETTTYQGGPGILLPQMKPDPAKVVPLKSNG